MPVDQIADRLSSLKARIEQACRAAHRNPDDVTLLGVSKTKTAEHVAEAYRLGVKQFGENYLDEALAKIQRLANLNIQWHFIGRIQSNKTRAIANHFDWVHTLDRSKIAQRLAEQRAGAPLNVLLQVNISNDPNKAGITPEGVHQLLNEVNQLPTLKPRGLMTILDPQADPGVSYQSMAQLLGELRSQLSDDAAADWQVLSMGMTGDLEAAIEAGATHLRIGTALFGPRD